MMLVQHELLQHERLLQHELDVLQHELVKRDLARLPCRREGSSSPSDCSCVVEVDPVLVGTAAAGGMPCRPVGSPIARPLGHKPPDSSVVIWRLLEAPGVREKEAMIDLAAGSS